MVIDVAPPFFIQMGRWPRQRLVAVFIILQMTTACASYNPQSVEKPSISSSSISRRKNGLAVGVNPYRDAQKSEKLFGADLREVRILALQVLVQNNSPRQLVVRKSDFLLRPEEGKEFLPAPVTSVASRLESSGEVVGWTLAFGIIGFLASSSQTDKADSSRRADLQNKDFKDSTLGPGDSAHGFVFFFIPEDVKALKAATLVVRAIDVADGTSTSVAIPLENLGDWNVNSSQ